MKTETLNSLLIDRELGELTPELAELLEAYLVAVPSARTEAEAIAATVTTARNAVRGLPVPIGMESRSRWLAAWPTLLARAAALLALLGVGAWLGYQIHTPRQTAQPPAQKPHELQRQWARYQLAYDAKHQGFVVQNRP